MIFLPPVDIQAYINAHPVLAAGVGALAAWFAPTPANCRRWAAETLALVKGAVMLELKPEEIKVAVDDVQKLVKLALKHVPGATADEKAAILTAEVKPLFDGAIAPLNLPGLVNDFAFKVLGWMIAAEVKAAEAVQ